MIPFYKNLVSCNTNNKPKTRKLYVCKENLTDIQADLLAHIVCINSIFHLLRNPREIAIHILEKDEQKV
jgi:hypothetical protein